MSDEQARTPPSPSPRGTLLRALRLCFSRLCWSQPVCYSAATRQEFVLVEQARTPFRRYPPPPPTTPNRPLCRAAGCANGALAQILHFASIFDIVAFCIKSAVLCLKLVTGGKCGLLHQNCPSSRGPQPRLVFPLRGTFSSITASDSERQVGRRSTFMRSSPQCGFRKN